MFFKPHFYSLLLEHYWYDEIFSIYVNPKILHTFEGPWFTPHTLIQSSFRLINSNYTFRNMSLTDKVLYVVTDFLDPF